MHKQERTSDVIASMAARYMKHPDSKVRAIAASALSNHRWGISA